MDIVSIIIGAVGSGLLATIVTIMVQKHSEVKRVKLEIFETLMSHRYLMHDKDNVEALNKIDVVFHNDTEVRRAWVEFLDAADRGAENPTANRNIDDKYLKLLEKIAIAIGKDADRDILARFTTDPNLVLNANNSTDLKNFIKWTSTLVTHTSQHATQTDRYGRQAAAEIKVPQPQTMLSDDSSEFV